MGDEPDISSDLAECSLEARGLEPSLSEAERGVTVVVVLVDSESDASGVGGISGMVEVLSALNV